MSWILAVDLAAKRSGVCLLDQDGTATVWDNKKLTEQRFLLELSYYAHNRHVVIEDVPPGLGSDVQAKAVYRLQGRVLQVLETSLDLALDITFLAPATWQRHHGVWGAGSARKFVYEDKATALGIPWPADERLDAKSIEDRSCAFLIAKWAADVLKSEGTLDVKGVSEYRDLRSPHPGS